MLLYYGKQLFGKYVDNPSLLAQTVFGIRLICLNGGPKFLTKLIPISKLTSAFLFEQNNLLYSHIHIYNTKIIGNIVNNTDELQWTNEHTPL